MNRRLLVCVLAASFSCSSSANHPGSGTAGNTGGSAGATGQAGSSGNAGATGQAGASGNAGATGQAGAGTAGATGQAGAGVAGATGQAGAGAAGNTGTAGTVVNSACGKLLPQQTGGSVLTRGKNAQRTAHFVEPALTIAGVMTKFGPDTAFNTAAKFSGGLEGSPLFVAGTQAGNGTFIVAGTGGTVTALDEATGAMKWMRALGGNVKSTPVVDAATGTLYVSVHTDHFEVHAMSLANMGAEVAGWPVNASNVKSTGNDMLGSFDAGKMVQRGALSLVNGVIYVPFGGVYGDGPPYKGFVVAINAANPTTTGGWSAGGDRSGLWQSGGLASDGTSMFATTSNGSDGNHIDSEEVIRITGMGASSHAGKDVFFPSNWKQWDGTDNDFGSSSPLVLQFSGQCQPLVVAPSKPGHLFFLDPANLGGANGNTPLRDLAVGNANAGGEYKVFYAAPTAYISASGVHVALEARLDAKCPNGGGGDSLVSVLLDMSTTPATPKVAWCAGVSGGEERHHPISTSTDGVQNSIVWFVVGGSLKGFNGETGAPVFSGTPCGSIAKQTAPIAAAGRVIVGADGKLCSYSVQP